MGTNDNGDRCVDVNEARGLRSAEWEPMTPQTAVSDVPPPGTSSARALEVQDLGIATINGAVLESRPVEWLWKPYLPRGTVVLVDGAPNAGKTFLMCAIGAGVTTGQLPGIRPFPPGRVLYISKEDDPGKALKPRHVQCGANMALVDFFVFENDDVMFDSAGFLRLDEAIQRLKPDLVVFDSLFQFVGRATDANRANDASWCMRELTRLAAKHGIVIVAIRHFAKSKGSGDGMNAGIGSMAFVGTARSQIIVGPDPAGSNRRAMLHRKFNLSEQGATLGFEIVSTQSTEFAFSARFEWLGRSEATEADILQWNVVPVGRPPARRLEAEQWLLDMLADGPVSQKEIKRLAEEAGLAMPTVKRAKSVLGVPSSKRESGWWWSLPEADQTQPQGGTSDPLGRGSEHLGPSVRSLPNSAKGERTEQPDSFGQDQLESKEDQNVAEGDQGDHNYRGRDGTDPLGLASDPELVTLESLVEVCTCPECGEFACFVHSPLKQ